MSKTIVIILGNLICPLPAFAHPGHELRGFLAGLAHPITGLDHVLTALAIGIFAVSSTQKVNLKILLGFIAAVSLGILAGQMGVVLPFYDQGIAISLGLLGICLFFGTQLKSWRATMLVACFGVLHGNAHGAELQNGGISFFAALGLMISTTLLLGLGTGVALVLRASLSNQKTTWILRLFGAGLVGTAFIL